MSKSKPIVTTNTNTSNIASNKPGDTKSSKTPARHTPSGSSFRETVESIAIAFILAFLFRTFEAEAFVIPTGSMAPTLMGRHKDLTCEKCGYPYQVNASDEMDPKANVQIRDNGVGSCTCPMCRYTMDIDGKNPKPSYSGDRIIVNKFSYQFEDPKRWDVIVFYYPEGARDNYIKRLAGLPNETIRIQFGDVRVRKDTADDEKNGKTDDFKIMRKPPESLLAMLQPVFDNDYMPVIKKMGWPVRWHSDSAIKKESDAWTTEDNSSYLINGTAEGEAWLRYQHLVPNFSQWNLLQSDTTLAKEPVKPQLITDFTPYNAGSKSYIPPTPEMLGLHWVGDLAVSATAELEGNSGQVILELVKGGRKFQCKLNAADGKAALSIDGLESFNPSAETNFKGPGKHEILFSNCDQELLLWIDGKVVNFDRPTTYEDLNNTHPTPADLTPAGVASLGAKMKLSHLKVMRDIYYIAIDSRNLFELQNKLRDRYRDDDRRSTLTDYIDYPDSPQLLANGKVQEFFSDPSKWSALAESNMRKVEFQLKDDQFFALGDNSAKSRDSRLWNNQHWIERDLLKGNALFIYWPHSWDKIPKTNIPFPFFPNFSRMHFIK